ncbi:MAG TPA: AMP-binding protein, partial [Bacillota bacterium]|nr:AMP-binding protein [Bacillota bacterium]
MSKLLWQHDYDFQFESREKTDRLQEEYLLHHINYCLEKSPFYQERYGRSIKEVSSLSDLSKLGFTTKDDLLKHNNDFLAVSMDDIVDTCFTSATVGTTPVNFLLTQSDLERLTHNEKVAFEISGVKKEDTMGVCVALERGFMAGLAYWLGGVKLGTHMIRIGASGSQHIWNLIRIHRPSVLIGVPSVLANVAIDAIHDGEQPSSIGVERILAIGEPLRDKNLRLLPSIQRIESLWNAPIFSTYASTEMATSFAECEHRQGGHFRPELIYVEIIDEEGNP